MDLVVHGYSVRCGVVWYRTLRVKPLTNEGGKETELPRERESYPEREKKKQQKKKNQQQRRVLENATY